MAIIRQINWLNISLVWLSKFSISRFFLFCFFIKTLFDINIANFYQSFSFVKSEKFEFLGVLFLTASHLLESVNIIENSFDSWSKNWFVFSVLIVADFNLMENFIVANKSLNVWLYFIFEQIAEMHFSLLYYKIIEIYHVNWGTILYIFTGAIGHSLS